MPQHVQNLDKIREGDGVKIIGRIEVGRPSLLSVFTEVTKSICDYFNIPFKKDGYVYTGLQGKNKEIKRYSWGELHDTPRNIAESNGDKIIYLYFQSEAGLTYSFRDCTDGENIIPPEKFVDELLNKYPLFRRI